MRKRGRTDDNQTEIMNALRRVGAGVQSTANIGDGFADLVVGFRGVNYLLEVKDGTKPPSKRKLTDQEINFHQRWPGQICVVNSVEEALQAIGAWKPKD